MTRARNIAGFSTITTTPSPVHVGPIGVLTATRIDGEFNQVDLATRNITAAGIAATNLQVSGITTGLNVSGIITAQNGINFNGTSTGLNVSGVGTIATLNVSGNATIAGVLTYEDVTNIDSIGIITARSGMVVSGVSTFGNDMQMSGTNPEFEFNSGGPRFRVPASNTLTLHKGGGLGSTSEETIRITSAGDVGINKTPTQNDMLGVTPRLHVLGISTVGQFNTVARFESGTTDGNDTGAAVVINQTNDRGLVIQGGRGGDADGVHHANSGLGRFSIINNGGTFHKFMEAWGQNGQYIENISLFTGNEVERLRIDSNGTVILKNTAAALPRSDFFGSLRPISQIASTWNAYHSLTRHDAGSSYGPYLMLAKNRNDAYNSNGTVQDNDELGNIAFLGNDGTAFREAARIRGEVDGTPGSSQVPGAITFGTNAGSGVVERARITLGGRLGLGTNSPDELLHLKSAASAGACIELDNNNNYKSQIKTSSDSMEIRAPQVMNFYTGNNDGASSTIRMKLQNTGELQHYSSSNAVQNLKFRSSDVNWHGYLNQTVAGGTIATIIANAGQWTVDGTTYAATKDYNGAFSTGAFIIHNQYNSSAGNATFTFKSKANGSSTTDGAISTYYTINSSGQHYFGDSIESTGNQDSGKFVFVGTKQYSGGIVQNQVAVVDAAAYNTTDNGGSIGFQAKYHSNGAYTQMASCGGLKANNTNGNYEGRFQIKVRNHNGNLIEYVSIAPTRSRFVNSLTTESELNLIRDDGTPSNKYMDIGYLNNTFHIRRTNGGDGGHTVHMTISSAGVISGNLNDTSDGKLKESIASIPDGSLALVKQLRPVTFDWKDPTSPNNQAGFVAQEVKTVISNLVNGEEYDETKVNEKGQVISTGYSINTTGIVAHLTKALQELSEKNDALEARIAALEGS